MIDKKDLLAWLETIDQKLNKKIILIAVGGTAMTLLGLKSSTRDIDFCVDSKHKNFLKRVLGEKFRVDLFVDGYIFSEQLPDDYQVIAKPIREMKHIVLRALHPMDIIITKTARLNARDEEDIETLSKHVNKEDLKHRFKEVIKTFAGKEEDYQYHFEIILKRFWK